ncbi:hypothetical protein ACFYWP_39775 [Actinacidiphila glaucinigra]|uniref:hypothetical protein n=1 Tax=Actinacidiphila glaucinigra TaxID=235986 RepID=UPI0036CB2B16
MNETTATPGVAHAPKTDAKNEGPRDWAVVTFAPCFLPAASRELAEAHVEEYPQWDLVSRVPGEPWPELDRLNPALMTRQQRAQLLEQLLADKDARDAALTTLNNSDLRAALGRNTETALVRCLSDVIQQAVNEGDMSAEPVTHVQFAAADYRSALRYDEHGARFHHTDGTITETTIEATPADDWLRDLSELDSDIGCDSLLTVDLTTDTVAYSTSDADTEPS